MEGGPLNGTLVWMYAHESYPDYDGYTVGGGPWIHTGYSLPAAEGAALQSFLV